MNVINSSLCCFAVLAVFAFSAIQCEIPWDKHAGLEFYNLDEDDDENFLAGEDTPVWIAYRPDGAESVNYTKLENGMVRKAIDYWRSDEFVGYIPRARRGVDQYTDTIKNLWNSVTQSSSVPMTDNNEEFSENEEELNPMKKRSNESGRKVLHPSVLIMMDYETDWPTNKQDQQKLIMERILYALAFWNGVDLQMRHLKNPKIRLRIVGIIIGRNKAAVPYLRANQFSTGLAFDNAFKPMVEYWGKMSNINKDFSLEAYDIVATMTDATPIVRSIYTTHGVASSRPPCYLSVTAKAAVLFHDNLTFKGILLAVHETAHVLGSVHDGDSADCPLEKGNVMSPDVNSMGKKWSKCSLERISTILNDQGWCMKNAKIYHSPGYPVEAILPGKLMWASKQCQALGWTDGSVCWDYVTCDDVYCSNNSVWSPCKSIGPAIDGTTCGTGRMCLGGRCVSNSTQFNA